MHSRTASGYAEGKDASLLVVNMWGKFTKCKTTALQKPDY